MSLKIVVCFVWCELCGGLKGFCIFFVCLVFGVVVIVGIGLVCFLIEVGIVD